MSKIKFIFTLALIQVLSQFTMSGATVAANAKLDHASVASQIFTTVKNNSDWKHAFLTAQHAQVVFMNISPSTNPNNEIGMETHPFDQIIFVVEGNAKAILNNQTTMVKANDMIFIPQGVAHNVINLNADKPLKILSIYSSTDIPAGSSYKKKSDEPLE